MELKHKGLIIFAVILSLLVLSFIIIKPLLVYLVLGALLAYVVYPLYRMLLPKIRNKTVTSLLLCLLTLVIIIIPIVYFSNMLVKESYVLYVLVKQKLAIGLFRGCENKFCTALAGLLDTPEISYQIQQISKAVTNWIITKGSKILLSIPRMLLNVFVLFFTMFYFLRDGKYLVEKVVSVLNLQQKEYTTIFKKFHDITHGVVFGYLLIALIQGALGALGFYLFGISSPLFWGMVMAFLSLIPYLGPPIIWVPASLFILLEGVFQDSTGLILKGIGLFVYSLLFVSTIDNILKPTLMGNKAKIHPAVVLLGIVGGVFLFGPFGVIIGPLILSLTIILLDLYVIKKEASIQE